MRAGKVADDEVAYMLAPSDGEEKAYMLAPTEEATESAYSRAAMSSTGNDEPGYMLAPRAAMSSTGNDEPGYMLAPNPGGAAKVGKLFSQTRLPSWRPPKRTTIKDDAVYKMIKELHGSDSSLSDDLGAIDESMFERRSDTEEPYNGFDERLPAPNSDEYDVYTSD
eukprot:UC1_evm1s1196